jgi:hypothetical protein
MEAMSAEIVEFIRARPGASGPDCERHFEAKYGVTRRQVQNDMKRLLKAGRLEREGTIATGITYRVPA